jgi:pyruvate dehydrogenase E2 component (dihydrolipoamide acetyltransferase)
VKKLFAPGSFEEMPHDHAQDDRAPPDRSQADDPALLPVTIDCELDALLKLREELNAAAPEVDGKPAYKVSVNDFVIKALALALKRRAGRQRLVDRRRHAEAQACDVGVAVSIPGGLITPVMRDA